MRVSRNGAVTFAQDDQQSRRVVVFSTGFVGVECEIRRDWQIREGVTLHHASETCAIRSCLKQGCQNNNSASGQTSHILRSFFDCCV